MFMMTAKISLDADSNLVISMDDYPNRYLSDSLIKLSIDNKTFSAPSGSSPQNPWSWRFAQQFKPALLSLLEKHKIAIEYL
jgi:hypothetical protein